MCNGAHTAPIPRTHANMPLQMLRKFLADQPDVSAGEPAAAAADGREAVAGAAAPERAAGSSAAGTPASTRAGVESEALTAAPEFSGALPGTAAAAVPMTILLPAAVLLPAVAMSASGAGAGLSLAAALAAGGAALWGQACQWLPASAVAAAAATAEQMQRLWCRLPGGRLQADEAAAAAAAPPEDTEGLPQNFYEQRSWPKWMLPAMFASMAWCVIDATLW